MTEEEAAVLRLEMVLDSIKFSRDRLADWLADHLDIVSGKQKEDFDYMMDRLMNIYDDGHLMALNLPGEEVN